jgi:chromosome segregation protein
LSQLAARKAEAESALEELRDQPAGIEDKRARLSEQIAASEERRQASAAELAAAESELSRLDSALRTAEQDLSRSREARVRAEADAEHAQERFDNVVVQIAEDLDCKPDETLALAEHDPGAPLPDIEDVAQRLDRLRRERDTMGPVNLRADDEAVEIETQLSTMIRERDDLDAAIGKLRHAIAALNKEGRERLQAAFGTVNEHFRALFTDLFGGGAAHLELSQSDDPLEAGLEIYASPPGKRLQHLSLLSGGEQALTALALIFAVFLTNPAPICILDEVDAPLDDANVERFCITFPARRGPASWWSRITPSPWRTFTAYSVLQCLSAASRNWFRSTWERPSNWWPPNKSASLLDYVGMTIFAYQSITYGVPPFA